MPLSLATATAALVAAFPRRPARAAAAPVRTPAPRKPPQSPVAALPPIPDPYELSYEPFRDYRPGWRSGDPARPF